MTIFGFTVEQVVALLSVIGLGAIIQSAITAFVNRKKLKADTTSTISETAVMVMEKTANRLKEVLDENKVMAEKIEKLEDEVRKLRERLEECSDSAIIRVIFRLLEIPCFILEANSGKIIDINDLVEKVYGYKREEIINKNIRILSSEPDKTELFLLNRDTKVYNRLHKTASGVSFYVDASAGYFVRDSVDYCLAIIKPKHSIEISDRIYDFLNAVIREFAGTHVCIWDFHNGEYTEEGLPLFKMGVKYEKASENYKSVLDSIKEIPTALFATNFALIEKTKFLIIQNTEEGALSGLLKYFKMSTMLVSPIMKEGKPVGVFTISFKDKKEFTEKEIDKFIYYADSELICDAIK
jgi:PAS domain S-box-containing protein